MISHAETSSSFVIVKSSSISEELAHPCVVRNTKTRACEEIEVVAITFSCEIICWLAGGLLRLLLRLATIVHRDAPQFHFCTSTLGALRLTLTLILALLHLNPARSPLKSQKPWLSGKMAVSSSWHMALAWLETYSWNCMNCLQ